MSRCNQRDNVTDWNQCEMERGHDGPHRFKGGRRCAVCRVVLNDKSVAERRDAQGREWCRVCTDKHDAIDFDELNERSRES